MHASDRGVESSTDTGDPVEARLAEVLLEGGEVAFGVRLRIAIDVLEQAANMGGELLPRARDGGLRLENVIVGADGVSRHDGEGTWGAAEIVWEILAGRALQGTAVPLRRVADDVTEPVEQLVTRMIARDRTLPDLEGIAVELEEAGRGYLDTHEDVRHAMGIDREPVDEDVAVSVAPSSMSRALASVGRPAAAATASAAGATASPAAGPAGGSREDHEPPPSAAARDPEEAGLLDEVDEAWPSSKSSRPPPPAKLTAQKPLRIIKLPPDEADLEETRLRRPGSLGTPPTPGSLGTPQGIERLDLDAEDRLTPDEPTLMRPKGLGLVRHVVRPEPVPQSVREAPASSPEPSPPAATATPTPSIARAGYEPIPVIDEDSDDGTEEPETQMYRARRGPGARKSKSPKVAGDAAETTETTTAASDEPLSDGPSSKPAPVPRLDVDDESMPPPATSSWVRPVLLALLVGSILAVVAFEAWKQVAPPPHHPTRAAPHTP